MGELQEATPRERGASGRGGWQTTAILGRRPRHELKLTPERCRWRWRRLKGSQTLLPGGLLNREDFVRTAGAASEERQGIPSQEECFQSEGVFRHQSDWGMRRVGGAAAPG